MSLRSRTSILVIATSLVLALAPGANAALADRHFGTSHAPDPSGLSKATAALKKYDSATTDADKRKAFSELEASLVAAIKYRPGTVTLLKKYLATKKTSEAQAATFANNQKTFNDLKIASDSAANDVTRSQSVYDAAVSNGASASATQKLDTTAVDLAFKNLETAKQAFKTANSDLTKAQSVLDAARTLAASTSTSYAKATKALIASPIGVLLVKVAHRSSNALASLSQRI